MKPSRPAVPTFARRRWVLACWAVAAGGVSAAPPRAPAAPATPPSVNLLVELRLADERQLGGAHAGYTVGTRDIATAPVQPVALQVLNGQGGQLQLGQQTWLQWTAAAGRTATPASGGAGGFVQQEVLRLDSGQVLQVVQVLWPGGEAPARLQIRFEAATAEPVRSGDGRIAQRGSQRVETTLQVPMDEWFTLARNGPAREAAEAAPHAGWTVSSRDAAQPPRRWLQVRISRL